APELLVYDDTTDTVWHFDLARESVEQIEPIVDNNLTALTWSHDGSRIGWVQRELRVTEIYSLSLEDSLVTQYHLSPERANDLSFAMWLPENPAEVIVRMQ